MSDFVHVESPTESEYSTGRTTGTETSYAKDSPSTIPLAPPLPPPLPPKPDSQLFFLKAHPFIRASVVEKIYGCIIGSALGDAIGLYTEFLPKDACETIYGARKFSLVEPVTEIYADTHRLRFAPCAWTDDTDQALLILLSYIQHPTDLDQLPQDFASRLHIWVSHGLLALERPPCGIGALVGSVVTSPSYLSDPTSAAITAWEKTNRHAAPNGSLMRTHPIGVIGVTLTLEETFKLAAAVSRTTHADPRCTVAVLIISGLIRGLLRGEVIYDYHIQDVVDAAWCHVRPNWSLFSPSTDPNAPPHVTELLGENPEHYETYPYVTAGSFEELDLDNSREMGYVYKCLGAAILCLRKCMHATNKCMRATNKGLCGPGEKTSPVARQTLFEEVMTELVMAGGDADTNGAVAGALMGAYLGHGYLPAHWATGLAHREWLDSKIERMCKTLKVLDGNHWNLKEEPDERPDGGKGLMSEAELEVRDRAMLHGIMERKRAREEMERKKGNKGFASWFGN